MFSSAHIAILVSCCLLIATATTLSVKFRLSSKKASVIFTVICVASEVTKDMVCMVPSNYGGYVLDQDDIPFHLCSVVVFFMVGIVLTQNDKIRENLMYIVVVIGTVAPVFALVIATEGSDLTRIITYQYFIYHSALMWFSLHHIISGQVRIGKRSFKTSICFISIFVPFLLYINSALSVYGVNFGFVRQPPMEGLPILNLEHGWYAYFATLLIIAYGSIILVHVPYMITEIIKKSK